MVAPRQAADAATATPPTDAASATPAENNEQNRSLITNSRAEIRPVSALFDRGLVGEYRSAIRRARLSDVRELMSRSKSLSLQMHRIALRLTGAAPQLIAVDGGKPE
jgi:hypothetical protein